MPQNQPEEFSVTENREEGRFELRRRGELVSYAVFTEQERGDETVLVVPHVETLPVHRGHGNAARLMDGMLDRLRSDGRRIIPRCSFAAAHVHGSAQHHDLLPSA